MGIWRETVPQKKARQKVKARATTARATMAKARATTAEARKVKAKGQIGCVIIVGRRDIWLGIVGPKRELKDKERVTVMEARANGEKELERWDGRTTPKEQKVHQQLKLVGYG